MAEETKKPTATTESETKPTEEVAAVSEPENVPVEKEAAEPPVSVSDAAESTAEVVAAEAPAKEEEVVEAENPEATPAGDDKITQSVSFKEESNVVGDLPESQKKALEELKNLIQEELNKHAFSAPPPPPPAEEVKEEEKKEEVVVEEKEEEVKADEEKKEKVAVVEEEKAAPSTGESSTSAAEEVKAVDEKPKEEAKPPPVETKEEKVVPPPEPAPPAELVVAEVVVEKVVAASDAKTVEAIEETVVAVATGEPSEPTKEEVTAPAAEEPKATEDEAAPPPTPEEVDIWGIPLLKDERSDVILLKFLRARDFKVKDAFKMIKDTARWRKEFGIDALLEEDHGSDWDKVVFADGVDKEGHPVCYNVFGPFEDKELYQNTFGDEAKRSKFLRWRIQFLEKSVRNLDFSPTGISTIFQVNDFKNLSVFGLGRKEFRIATNRALQLLQDNYPELVAKQVFINVPWWYLAFNRMISPFLTQRTKSKFVFAGPTKTAETLFKYIAPEQVPVQYGGLKKEGEQEFTAEDTAVTEVTIKPTSKHEVEIPVVEKGVVVWEVRVVGWDVSYGAEFVPSGENGYTVIIQKKRKIGAVDEVVISNSFKVGEAGKVVLTIDNTASKKKKLLLYRSKVNPTSE